MPRVLPRLLGVVRYRGSNEARKIDIVRRGLRYF